MMGVAGRAGEILRIESFESEIERDAGSSADDPGGEGVVESVVDPYVRMMRVLEGYVAPLDFDIPAVVSPGNLLDKMGAWQAQRAAMRDDKKEAKRRAKTQAGASSSGGDGLRAKDEKQLDRKLAKLEITLDKPDIRHEERDVRKAQVKYDRKQKKVGRKVEKRAGKKSKHIIDDKEER
jgi:hypothetical protein